LLADPSRTRLHNLGYFSRLTFATVERGAAVLKALDVLCHPEPEGRASYPKVRNSPAPRYPRRNESFAEPGKLRRRTMPAYLISLCRHVTDRKRLEDYWANVAPAFKGFDAKPLVAYKPFEVLEGDGGVRGVVLFEFPSMEEARHWYTSAAYQEVKKRREGAANFDLILVEGGFVAAAERMPESKS
jgi:uncharacterized protein (DUF1330 family)